MVIQHDLRFWDVRTWDVFLIGCSGAIMWGNYNDMGNVWLAYYTGGFLTYLSLYLIVKIKSRPADQFFLRIKRGGADD